MDSHVPYAIPVARTASRGWAGAAIILGGLALVLLGGCFLIGVMITLNHDNFSGGFNATPSLSAAPER